MNDIYVLVLQGIYIQAVLGVFIDYDRAFDALKSALLQEPDDADSFDKLKGKLFKNGVDVEIKNDGIRYRFIDG